MTAPHRALMIYCACAQRIVASISAERGRREGIPTISLGSCAVWALARLDLPGGRGEQH